MIGVDVRVAPGCNFEILSLIGGVSAGVGVIGLALRDLLSLGSLQFFFVSGIILGILSGTLSGVVGRVILVFGDGVLPVAELELEDDNGVVARHIG